MSNDDAIAKLIGQALALSQNGGDRARDARGLEDDVLREGTRIILPNDPEAMSLRTGIETLERMEIEQSQKIQVVERIRGVHFVDGLVAFNKAMAEVFGWTEAVTVRTFFGPQYPTSIDVETDLGQFERLITGRFEIPNVPGYVDVGSTFDDGLHILVIQGVTTKKFKALFERLADVTRRLARTGSIYRNKAIELKFDDDGHVSPDALAFVNVAGGENPIFSRDTELAIEANIMTPIKHTARCKAAGIPIKRGVLLEGPYGTGKTLVSRRAAQVALSTGKWTFILVRDAANVAGAVEFARRFQPAVVFVEDIDREMEGDDRTEAMDRVLNTMDGVDSKNADLIVVFTSNHADTINQAMIRPGRLDAVITIAAPDAEAAERLVRAYGGELLDPSQDYTIVGETLAGSPAAVIRETVERAKLYAIAESGDADTPLVLTPTSLADAGATMRRQLDLLNRDKQVGPSPYDMFINDIATAMLSKTSPDIERLPAIDANVRSIKAAVNS